MQNTLRYMFYHMRCGIYVMVRGGSVRMFVPFANRLYRNSWPALEFRGGSRHQYYHRKDLQYKVRERVIQREDEWWSNGHLLCNVRSPQVWGDHFLRELHEMLEATCERHEVADAEFFLNKRDFPHLRVDHTKEPYPLFESMEMQHNRFRHLCPILSFYTAPDFADIPLPLPQDWTPPPELEQDDGPAWSDRVPTAFFRGSATGAGTTPETNQRLRLAQMSQSESRQHDGVPLLDAGITSWNMRDKKSAGQPVDHIRPDQLEIGLQPYVPLVSQRRYRYLIYADGHCAASRYSQMMRSGSLILKVESRGAGHQLWFFPLLEPFVDHVPVRADLSDLHERIEWCLAHDDECARMAARARALAERHLSRGAIAGYLAQTINAIGKKQADHPEEVEPHTPLYSGYPPPCRDYLRTLRAAMPDPPAGGARCAARATAR